MKRFLSAVLAAAMLLCTLPAAFAASDIETHWAKQYLLAMQDIGVINPSSEGLFTPNNAIARWEFMRYINRAFGFTEKASVSYTDVPSGSLYEEIVQTAVYYGYINGIGNNKMDPTGTLTREQAATILGRLHKYTPTADLSALNAFSDRSQISDYAEAYVAEAVAQGYINGYTDGTFLPKGSIKRGEIAKILYYFLGSSLNTADEDYTGSALNSDTNNVTISAGCTLSDATVDGNLYITEGVDADSVTLRDVTVKGDIIVSGGSVTLDDVSALHLTVSNPTGLTPQVICTGSTSIGTTEVQTSAALTESSLSASGGGFADLDITGDGLSLTLDAAVWDVTTAGETSILTTGSTSISALHAYGETTVTGGGSVQSAALHVSGCELIMEPGSYTLDSGVTAVIGGQSVSSSNSVTVSPSSLSIDINDPDSISHSYDFTFNADKDDLVRVTIDDEVLALGTDYNLLTGSQDGIRLYKSYLTTLKAGAYTAKLLFMDGSTASIGILVGNSALSAITPSQLTFDKYEESPYYANVTATIVMPSGTTLSSVKLGSTTLERGVDYAFNTSTGVFTLMCDTLSGKSKGSYTLTFTPSKGSTFSCTLTIVDSTPVNNISPSEVDFDANTSSGGYADIAVTLSTVDDAELKYIRANGKTLEEDWQYKLEGSTVTISKSAVSSVNENNASYIDFTFVMSTGQNPVLRVNYVTTYALTASVVDDLGLPVEGAQVTFRPTDDDAGTATQTLYTDADGKATVYVQRGSYKVTASYDRFTEAVSSTVSVSAARTVKLTGEILETVQIVVTNAYGAPLSGAIVTIGGQSITTGTDGTASFSLKRGSYMAQIACTGYTAQTIAVSVTGSVRERVQLQ